MAPHWRLTHPNKADSAGEKSRAADLATLAMRTER